MIKRLILCNFGPFENLDITFSDITRIFGENGSGKSHIFDALHLVLSSDRFPEYFVKHGQSFSSAKVYLDNSVSLERVRDGSEQYLVIEEGSTLRKYNNPLQMKDEVSRITGFYDIQLDAETKESCQFLPIDADQFFMVQGVSPVTVMRRISNLVSGSDFSIAKKTVQAKIKEDRAVLKHLKSQLVKDNDKYKGLDDEYFASLKKSFYCLQEVCSRVENLESNIQALKETIINLEKYGKDYDKFIKTLDTLAEAGLVSKEKIAKDIYYNVELSSVIYEVTLQSEDVMRIEHEVSSLYERILKEGGICEMCGGFIGSE